MRGRRARRVRRLFAGTISCCTRVAPLRHIAPVAAARAWGECRPGGAAGTDAPRSYFIFEDDAHFRRSPADADYADVGAAPRGRCEVIQVSAAWAARFREVARRTGWASVRRLH